MELKALIFFSLFCALLEGATFTVFIDNAGFDVFVRGQGTVWVQGPGSTVFPANADFAGINSNTIKVSPGAVVNNDPPLVTRPLKGVQMTPVALGSTTWCTLPPSPQVQAAMVTDYSQPFMLTFVPQGNLVGIWIPQDVFPGILPAGVSIHAEVLILGRQLSNLLLVPGTYQFVYGASGEHSISLSIGQGFAGNLVVPPPPPCILIPAFTLPFPPYIVLFPTSYGNALGYCSGTDAQFATNQRALNRFGLTGTVWLPAIVNADVLVHEGSVVAIRIQTTITGTLDSAPGTLVLAPGTRLSVGGSLTIKSLSVPAPVVPGSPLIVSSGAITLNGFAVSILITSEFASAHSSSQQITFPVLGGALLLISGIPSVTINTNGCSVCASMQFSASIADLPSVKRQQQVLSVNLAIVSALSPTE